MKTEINSIVRITACIAAAFALVGFTGTASAQSPGKVARVGLAQKVTKRNLIKSKADQAAADSIERLNRIASGEPAALGNATNYAFATSTSGTFTSMTGSTQLVGAGQDDAASPNTPIGFDFWLQGARYTQFSVTSNGFVGLSSTGGSVSNTNYSIAGGSVALPLIAGCGGDLETAASVGKIHYKVTGAAPNRVLTIEFTNMTIVYSGVTPEADGTFQVRLYETTGQIEFVYGAMMRGTLTGSGVGNSGNLGIGYFVAAANGSLVSIVSATNAATTTTPFTQQSYSAGPIANLNSPGGDGTRRVYSLTPPSVTAPTNLSFANVTPIAMTLNWIDSPDETNYGIYRSTDNVTFTFAGIAALNATSFNATGLNPNTNYFWQVRAISDGTVSTALAGSQATTIPGVATSTAAGGNWSDTATWAGGVLPTTNDNVTIVGGATVTVDVTNAVALNVTVQSGGTLQYIATPASTLTLALGLTIDSGGTVTAGTGTLTTHLLSVGGDLTNNGTLDLFTTAGVGLTFTGSSSNTFGGTGATTDIRTMTVNKGANTNVLEMSPTNFTVQNVNTDVAGFLTLTSGTLKISGSFTMTNRVFATANYAIGGNAGIWLNNPNFTVAGQASAATLTGLFRMTQGTYNIGTATGNALAFNNSSTIIVEGGAINSTGRFAVASATNNVNYTQTGGTITVCTIGNTSNSLGNFDLGTSSSSNVTMSGGTIIIRLHSSGIDYRYDADPSNLTGTVVQLGDAGSGAAKAFSLRGVLPNLVITNTSANHTAAFNNTLVNFYHVITGNVTINTGNTLNLAGDVGNSVFTFFEGNIVNNGILNASNVNMSMEVVGDALQTYSGTGTMTAPTTDMDIDGGGVDFTGATNQQVISRINLFSGSLSGANKITLGNGGATAAFFQIGNGGPPATVVGPVTGTIVNNAGSGGYTIFYGDVTADRSTGGEIPASGIVSNVTFDSEGPNVTIAGGDLMVTGTTTFGDAADVAPNGRVITGANKLIIGSAGTVVRVGGLGYVDGNLVKNFATNSALTFEVGTANGYSPVLVNMTAGAPAPFTVKAVQGPQPNIPNPTMALQRYWTLTGSGVTADLTFNYLDPTDIPVTANENNFVIFKYNGSLTMPGGSVNTAANTATITGVNSFSDWTLAEPTAPLVASSAVSRKVHGGAGMFDINLPLSGSPGVECRSGGAMNNYQIVVTFASSVTVNTAAVTSGTGSVTTASGNGTNTITVDLTGVTNAQYVTVTLQGATNGTNSGDIPVTMGVLVGDVNGSRSVTGTDVSTVKSQSGNVANAGNFRTDVNASGAVTGTDVSITKAQSGTGL